MPTNREQSSAKWFLLSLLVFMIAAYFCYTETVCALNGREANATITDVSEVTRQIRKRERKEKKVQFTYLDINGSKRSGEITMPEDWTASADRNLRIRYTLGNDEYARQIGNVNWVSLIIFLTSATLVAFCGIRYMLVAMLGIQPRKRERKKSREYF